MTARSTNRSMMALTLMVLMVTVAVVIIGTRSENTRQVVEHNPCTLDSSSKECQRVNRNTVRDRDVRDTCIIQKKTLRPRYYFTITRCPRFTKRRVNMRNSHGVTQHDTPLGAAPTGATAPAPPSN